MTIREHFRRFQKRVNNARVAVGLVAAVIFLWREPRGSQLAPYAFGAGFALAWLAVFALFLRKRYVCPRCGADFIQLRREMLGRFNPDRRLYWDLWEKCPHCGVSFDEPWPEQHG